MPTDPKIQEAIESAVRKAGQRATLSTKIVAWFDAMASGNERPGNTDEADRHLELLYAETEAPSPDDETAQSDHAEES